MCVFARARKDRWKEEGQGGGSTWHGSACVHARLIAPAPVLRSLNIFNAVQRE